MEIELHETCSSIEKLIEKLGKPATERKVFADIEKITGVPIPNSIKVIIGDVDALYDYFGGWKFTTPEKLCLEYSVIFGDLTENASFFDLLQVDDKFEILEDRAIIYDDLLAFPGRYEIGDKITNLKRLLPLANAGHANLLLNISLEAQGELLACHYCSEFYVYAPNVEEHLLDLVDGLRSGRYPLEKGHIGVGDTWLERLESRNNNLAFDMDGVLQKGSS